MAFLVMALFLILAYRGTAGIMRDDFLDDAVPFLFAMAAGFTIAASIRRNNRAVWLASGLFAVAANLTRAYTVAKYGATGIVSRSDLILLAAGVYGLSTLGCIAAWVWPLRPEARGDA